MEPRQEIIEDGTQRTLEEFATIALAKLEADENTDEVVQQADNIVELKNDAMTHPRHFYELPEGYSYRFSGFWGQVIGIIRDNWNKA